MKSKHKAIAAIAGLAALAGLAYASSSGAASEDESAGLLLGEDCSSITVVDPGHFVEDFTAWATENDIATVLELDQPQDVEEMLVAFLRETFPRCDWPPAGGAFTWDAPLPPMPGNPNAQQYATRSWEQLINSVTATNAGLASAVNPIAATAQVLATSSALGPVPVPPDEGEPDDDRPLPPIPPFDPDGLGSEGGGGEIIPDNVLQAIDAHHMMDAGVERAMEPGKGLAPIPSSVVVVYDPNAPSAGALIDAVMAAAEAAPEVLFVLATTDDTAAAFGLPEEPSTVGWAINAANRNGKYWKTDALSAGYEDDPPTQQQWRRILQHAQGPGDQTQPQRFGFSSAGQHDQPTND